MESSPRRQHKGVLGEVFIIIIVITCSKRHLLQKRPPWKVERNNFYIYFLKLLWTGVKCSFGMALMFQASIFFAFLTFQDRLVLRVLSIPVFMNSFNHTKLSCRMINTSMFFFFTLLKCPNFQFYFQIGWSRVSGATRQVWQRLYFQLGKNQLGMQFFLNLFFPKMSSNSIIPANKIGQKHNKVSSILDHIQ